MSFTSLSNKYLKVSPNVILTPIIDAVITKLDPYFINHPSVVTSGLRDAYKQLEVIRQYLKIKGLDSKYPQAMTCKPTDMVVGNSTEYVWQMAWSNLLSVGVIINPPLQAKCLMDYIRNGVNKKGEIISQTPHARGTAFNIGAGANGVEDEAAILQKALNDKLPGLADFIKERENNALHCDCYAVK